MLERKPAFVIFNIVKRQNWWILIYIYENAYLRSGIVSCSRRSGDN